MLTMAFIFLLLEASQLGDYTFSAINYARKLPREVVWLLLFFSLNIPLDNAAAAARIYSGEPGLFMGL